MELTEKQKAEIAAVTKQFVANWKQPTQYCKHCDKDQPVDILFHGGGEGALQCMVCWGVI